MKTYKKFIKIIVCIINPFYINNFAGNIYIFLKKYLKKLSTKSNFKSRRFILIVFYGVKIDIIFKLSISSVPTIFLNVTTQKSLT